MTQISIPWGGTSTGDAGPYGADDWSNIWKTLFTVDSTSQGIVPWYGGKLNVTNSGGYSPANIATGAAIVHGTFYQSDASEQIAIPSPVSNNRTDYIVLRKDHINQTIRLTRLAGTEGGSPPTLTQNETTYWDIRIASTTITPAGALSIVNDNIYIHLGVPVNGVIYSTSTTIPDGFSELTSARGRFIVGMPSGGTVTGTVGTALTDLETMSHSHEYNEVVYHRHGGYGRAAESGDLSNWNQANLITWGSSSPPQTHLTASGNGSMDYEGSATCNTELTDTTPPYLQLMVLVKN